MTPTKPEDALVERLRDESMALRRASWSRPEGGQDGCIAASLADEAADTITTLLERERRALAALKLAVPIIEEEREVTVSGYTVLYRGSPDLGKVVDPDAVEQIEKYDAALNAARAALTGEANSFNT